MEFQARAEDAKEEKEIHLEPDVAVKMPGAAGKEASSTRSSMVTPPGSLGNPSKAVASSTLTTKMPSSSSSKDS